MTLADKTVFRILSTFEFKKNLFSLIFILFFSLLFTELSAQEPIIRTGAENTEVYLPLLKGKRVALVANNTSIIDNTNLVDSLLKLNVQIIKIFCPEHGFRGKGDAGEAMNNSVDPKTGLSLISIYGEHVQPQPSDLEDVDIVVFDLQDVGVRFYTYTSTLYYVMEACAENGKELILLDRPNPNGFYVDGPVLKKRFKSFVGLHQVAMVHGMTLGEYAQMIIGEDWLKTNKKCNLKVVCCTNYTHKSLYRLKVNPSPNLQNMLSIYLYPSLALFEGTRISVGRGTDFPFQVFGHPQMTNASFTFTPRSIKGICKYPPLEGQTCYGVDLRNVNEKEIIEKKQIDLSYLKFAYENFPDKENFFNEFFYNLSGTQELRKQIEKNVPIEEIRESWQGKLSKFKEMRKKYLLYPDFE